MQYQAVRGCVKQFAVDSLYTMLLMTLIHVDLYVQASGPAVAEGLRDAVSVLLHT